MVFRIYHQWAYNVYNEYDPNSLGSGQIIRTEPGIMVFIRELSQNGRFRLVKYYNLPR